MAGRQPSPFANLGKPSTPTAPVALDKAMARSTRDRSTPPPPAELADTPQPTQAGPSPARPQHQLSGAAPARTPVRLRRTITRYAFEFYQDQLEELRRLSLSEKLEGGKGSMSEMVREAIDLYLSKRREEMP